MSTNLERFKAIVERGFSQGDLTVADEVCNEKLVEHQYLARTDVAGPQILKAQIEDARQSIKDLKFTIESVIESRDTVWARGKATGVDPRSGKPVTIDVIDICRFADGKLVEHWGVPDRFALLSPAWSAAACTQTNLTQACRERRKGRPDGPIA